MFTYLNSSRWALVACGSGIFTVVIGLSIGLGDGSGDSSGSRSSNGFGRDLKGLVLVLSKEGSVLVRL